MGISYQASDIFNKMKLLSTIVAVASAANNWWPGQSGGAACGSQLTFEDDSVAVNSTCTVDFGGFNPQHVSIPNCFNAGTGSFASIDCDIIVGGGSLDVLVFWEQNDNGTHVDDSTCGNWTDITVSCSDNGAQPEGLRMGNFANNYHLAATSSSTTLISTVLVMMQPLSPSPIKLVTLPLSSTLLALHAAVLLLTQIQSVSPLETEVNS